MLLGPGEGREKGVVSKNHKGGLSLKTGEKRGKHKKKKKRVASQLGKGGLDQSLVGPGIN